MTIERRPLVQRFWDRVTPGTPTECWIWPGTRNNKGYGLIGKGGRGTGGFTVHRVSWMIHRGPIPDGKWVLHRCDTPACVNPDHLFIGTHRDNMADMVAKGRHPRSNALKTECKHGHPFSEANTFVRPSGKRMCRTCSRNTVNRQHAATRAQYDHLRQPCACGCGQLANINPQTMASNRYSRGHQRKGKKRDVPMSPVAS